MKRLVDEGVVKVELDGKTVRLCNWDKGVDLLQVRALDGEGANSTLAQEPLEVDLQLDLVLAIGVGRGVDDGRCPCNYTCVRKGGPPITLHTHTYQGWTFR